MTLTSLVQALGADVVWRRGVATWCGDVLDAIVARASDERMAADDDGEAGMSGGTFGCRIGGVCIP